MTMFRDIPLSDSLLPFFSHLRLASMFSITCNAVGDIATLAALVLDVVQAFNEARGSTSEYRTLAIELHSMHTLLIAISRLANESEDNALRDEIVSEVDRCGLNVQSALARIAKFSVLGRAAETGDARRVRFARQWYKLEWRFVQRGDAQAVRAELQAATQRLTVLLVVSNACVYASWPVSTASDHPCDIETGLSAFDHRDRVSFMT